MNIFLIFNFSANLAIIFDFADESIVFHEYAGAYSRPACRAGTTDQMTDNVAGGQSAIGDMATDLPRPKSEDLHESQGKIQGGPGGNALDLR